MAVAVRAGASFTNTINTNTCAVGWVASQTLSTGWVTDVVRSVAVLRGTRDTEVVDADSSTAVRVASGAGTVWLASAGALVRHASALAIDARTVVTSLGTFALVVDADSSLAVGVGVTDVAIVRAVTLTIALAWAGSDFASTLGVDARAEKTLFSAAWDTDVIDARPVVIGGASDWVARLALVSVANSVALVWSSSDFASTLTLEARAEFASWVAVWPWDADVVDASSVGSGACGVVASQASVAVASSAALVWSVSDLAGTLSLDTRAVWTNHRVADPHDTLSVETSSEVQWAVSSWTVVTNVAIGSLADSRTLVWTSSLNTSTGVVSDTLSEWAASWADWVWDAFAVFASSITSVRVASQARSISLASARALVWTGSFFTGALSVDARSEVASRVASWDADVVDAFAVRTGGLVADNAVAVGVASAGTGALADGASATNFVDQFVAVFLIWPEPDWPDLSSSFASDLLVDPSFVGDWDFNIIFAGLGVFV